MLVSGLFSPSLINGQYICNQGPTHICGVQITSLCFYFNHRTIYKVRETCNILSLCWMPSLYGKINIKIIKYMQFNQHIYIYFLFWRMQNWPSRNSRVSLGGHLKLNADLGLWKLSSLSWWLLESWKISSRGFCTEAWFYGCFRYLCENLVK